MSFFSITGPKETITGRTLTTYDHALAAKRWGRVACALLAVIAVRDLFR